MLILLFKLRFGVPVYLARRSYDVLAKYFHKLEIFPAEDQLCGFEKVYEDFR